MNASIWQHYLFMHRSASRQRALCTSRLELGRHVWALLALLSALPTVVAVGQSGPARPPTGKLRGVAYDSVRSRPLSRATIQLIRESDPSTVREITADSLGRFSVDSLQPGRWIVGARHPFIDSLAVEQLAVRVDVKRRGTTRATVAVPAGRSLVARVCGDSVARDSSGYVHGLLRNARALDVGMAGSVRVQWVVLTLSQDRMDRSIEGVQIRTTPEGRYVACGVPLGGALRIRAWSGADSTGVLEVSLPAHGIAQLDLAIGEAIRTTMTVAGTPDAPSGADTSATADSLPAMDIDVVRGTASIEGVARAVTGDGGEQPLANARVSVWGSGLEVRSAGDGRFALNGLPTGSYIMETVAIGYQPSRTIVELRPHAPLQVSTRMERLLTLDTVQVRAMRTRALGPRMVAFEQRRRRGLGKFLGPDELDKQFVSQTSDFFRMIPGVRVVSGMGGDQVLLRGDSRGYCRPLYFVDGMRLIGIEGQTSISSYVSALDIQAIEVYVSNITAPPEFSSGFTTCGSIVIWTGARR